MSEAAGMGRANQAVVALLARALPVPACTVAVTSGQTKRGKTLRSIGDPAILADRLGGL